MGCFERACVYYSEEPFGHQMVYQGICCEIHICEQFPQVCKAIKELTDSNIETADTVTGSTNLLGLMQTFSFLSQLHMGNEVLHGINKVNIILEKVSTTVDTAAKHLQGVRKKVTKC